MLTLFLAAAAVAAPPCEDPTRPDYLEGEHFWIEWDPAVGNAEVAAQNLQWAEDARRIYMDDFGYDFIDQTILIRIEESPSSGGLTTTVQCTGGGVAPHITLFARELGSPGENTAKHEVVHAVQYAYMGSYLNAIQSWPWWMEGHATWLTYKADPDLYEQIGPSYGYLDVPWLGLHQTQLAYTNPVNSRYLYGTVLIALHIEREYGEDTVRALWEYGSPLSGTQIYFPDAIEAVGLDFDSFWYGFMAEVVGLSVPDDDFYPTEFWAEDHVGSLPASGEAEEETQPQGLGLSAIHFRKSSGVSGMALTVNFEGDPSVPWLAQLVRTRGKGPGAKLEETVPLVVGADGKGSASLANFDGSRDGWLVVSPMSQTLEPHAYSWSASLDAPEAEAEKKGCGCESAPVATPWLALVGLLSLFRRKAAPS